VCDRSINWLQVEGFILGCRFSHNVLTGRVALLVLFDTLGDALLTTQLEVLELVLQHFHVAARGHNRLDKHQAIASVGIAYGEVGAYGCAHTLAQQNSLIKSKVIHDRG